MILSNIKINNFRQYRSVDLCLGYEKNKNITTFVGINGAGKSNLFGSIIWCLFNREPDAKDNRQKNAQYDYVGILHEPSFVEADINDVIDVDVTLTFQDKDYLSGYKISRSNEFMKITDSKHDVISDDYTIYEKKETGGWKLLERSKAAAFLLKFIPEEISSFYFFDGEKLDDFFKSSGLELKKQIIKVAQLEIVTELTKKRLPSIKKLFMTSGDHDEEITRLRSVISRATTTIGKNQDDIERYNTSIAENENALDEINQWLERYKDINVSENSKKIIDLGEKINDLNNSLNALRNQRLELVHECLPSLAGNDYIQKFREKVSKLYDENKIPPAIDRGFIDALLDNKMCICDRPLEEHSEATEHVKKLREQDYELGEMGRSIMELDVVLKNNLERALLFPEKVKALTENEVRIKKIINSDKEEVEELKELIKDIDIAEVNSQVSQKEITEESLKNDRPKRQGLIGENSALESSLKTDRRQLEKWQRKNISDKYKKNRFDIIADSISLLNNVSAKAMVEIKDEITNETNDNFFNIEGRDEFEKILVSDDYRVDVKRNDGRMADKLSAGQSQILAFSFIEALNTRAGLNMPIIIDTPLGRISSKNKINIARSISKLLNERQVILLFTDSEYSDEVKREITSSLNNSYILKKDKTLTTIETS